MQYHLWPDRCLSRNYFRIEVSCPERLETKAAAVAIADIVRERGRTKRLSLTEGEAFHHSTPAGGTAGYGLASTRAV
jgi:hypothetical protein